MNKIIRPISRSASASDLYSISRQRSPLPELGKKSPFLGQKSPLQEVLSSMLLENSIEVEYKSTLLIESTLVRTSVMISCNMYAIREYTNGIERKEYIGFVFTQPDDVNIVIAGQTACWFLFEKNILLKSMENPINNVLKRKMSLGSINVQSSFIPNRSIYDFVTNKIMNSMAKNNTVTLTLNPILEDIMVNQLLISPALQMYVQDIYQDIYKEQGHMTKSDFSSKMSNLQTGLAEVKCMNKDIKRQILVINTFLSLKKNKNEELKRVLRILVRKWKSRKN